MNRPRLYLTAASVACAAALLIGSQAKAQDLRGKVTIDGSSTVYPITEAVAEEFGKVHKRVRVTVGISGTGGGFKRFAIGETDISDASRPIKKDEADAAEKNSVKYIELPVAYDGLSIVMNKKNTWCKSLTVDQLKKVFVDPSPVKTWKDLDPSYPATPIKLFIPGTDSGTFDYFKEVVVGKGSVRPDVSVSEDDNVLVTGIAGNEGGLGFFGCAYYFANKDKISVVPIDGGKGPVAPTAETIENGSYAPFSRPLFIYVNAAKASDPAVDAFVKFYFEHGPKLTEEVGYVRLPSEVYSRAKANYEARKTGSQYLQEDGKHKQGPIMDIYK